MKTFYDFLAEQEEIKPNAQPQQGQLPLFKQPQQGQPQQGQPQQGQPQMQRPSNEGVYILYRSLNNAFDKGIKAVTDFVNAHPRKNEWYEGAKLMNLYAKIQQENNMLLHTYLWRFRSP